MAPSVDVKNEVRISIIVFSAFSLTTFIVSLFAPRLSLLPALFGTLATLERLHRIALRANSRPTQFLAGTISITLFLAFFGYTYLVWYSINA